MVKRLSSVLAIFLICIPVFGATLSAQLDRDRISENQSFHLLLISDTILSAEPDLSPLEQHFDVINTTQSTQTSIINGKTTIRSEWNITLIPKYTGTLRIPPIQVGKLQTQASQIVVSPKAAGQNTQREEHIFIKVDANPRQPYVNSQILYSVKLYYDVTIQNASLTEPTVKNAELSRIGSNLRYTEKIYGRTYQVTELRYVVVPKESGSVLITAPAMIGHVQSEANTFAGADPFFAGTGKAIRVVGQPLRLSVLPIPSGINTTEWLPASKFVLTESWSPETPQFKVGEPVTRSINIQALGLKATQIPNITMETTNDYKVYPDHPTYVNGEGKSAIIGERDQKFAIIPTHAGQITLPEIKIAWFDTTTHKLRTAKLPEKTFQVTAIPGGQQKAIIPPAIQSTVHHTIAAPQVTTTSNQESSFSHFLPVETWESLAILFFVAWICTISAWLWQITKGTPDEMGEERPAARSNDEKQALKDIKQACTTNDAKHAHRALLHWASFHWPEQTITSLTDIATCLAHRKLQAELDNLNRCLYSPEKPRWAGMMLWQQLALALNDEKKRQTLKSDEPLAPLYPSN